MTKMRNKVILRNKTTGAESRATNASTFYGAYLSTSLRGEGRVRSPVTRCDLVEFPGTIGGTDFLEGRPPNYSSGRVAFSGSPENYSWTVVEEDGVVFLREEREWKIHVGTEGDINLVSFLPANSATGRMSFFAEVDPPFSVKNGDTVEVTHVCYGDLTGSTDLDASRGPELPAYVKVGESPVEVTFSDIDGMETSRVRVNAETWVLRAWRTSQDWPPGALDGWKDSRSYSNNNASVQTSTRSRLWLEQASGGFMQAYLARDGISVSYFRDGSRRVSNLKGFGDEGDLSSGGQASPLLALGTLVKWGIRAPAGASPFSFKGLCLYAHDGDSLNSSVTRTTFTEGTLGDFPASPHPGTDFGAPTIYVALDDVIEVPADNSFSMRVQYAVMSALPEGAEQAFPGIGTHPPVPGEGFEKVELPGLNGEPWGRGKWDPTLPSPVFVDADFSESMFLTRTLRGTNASGYVSELPQGSAGKEFHFSSHIEFSQSTTTGFYSFGMAVEFLDQNGALLERVPFATLNGSQAAEFSYCFRAISGEIPAEAEQVRVETYFQGSPATNIYFQFFDAELWIEGD